MCFFGTKGDFGRRTTTVKILLSEEQLREGVDRLAGDVAAAWGPRPMTMVGVLNGCIVFLADLIRRLEMPLRVELIQASSYRGQTIRGELRIAEDLQIDLQGRDVLLVDDIFDTGHTLVEVRAKLRACGPSSIRSAVLLRKLGRQEVDLEPEFVGFHVPNRFVVGYGLDYRDEFRNLPYVATLDSEDLREFPHQRGGAVNR